MTTEPSSMAETGVHDVVIGLDGGGSHTRAICADLDGNVLARFQSGAAHPGKNPDAELAVKAAVDGVLHRAGRSAYQVRACVAGLAGLNSVDDLAWAESFLALPGLAPKAHCVNDAVVAWAGALCLQPGIVAIAGTGAIVFGVTESGRQLRDYDFRHYGDLRARDLVAALVHQIVIGEAQAADADLVAAVYQHFGVDDRDQLAQVASTAETQPRDQFIRLYGALGSVVTAAALDGLPLAQRVCDVAVDVMAISIRLVGSQFETLPVRLVLVGSVLASAYVSDRMTEVLRSSAEGQFEVIQPRLSPEAGAALMALEQCGSQLSSKLIDNLAQEKRSRFARKPP